MWKGDGDSKESERAKKEAKNPPFPCEGWTCIPSCFPKVTFSTIVAHMLKSGKTVDAVEDNGYFLAMRPLYRANEFFFGGYVQDISVSRKENTSFVLSKCWASQKKATQYRQKMMLSHDPQANDETRVEFATCEGCVAGTDGGLCSHVLALLLVLERYRTTSGETSVTSLPQSWGPRQRDVVPEPVAKVVVERANIGRKGDAISHTLHEARSTRLRIVDMGAFCQL